MTLTTSTATATAWGATTDAVPRDHSQAKRPPHGGRVAGGFRADWRPGNGEHGKRCADPRMRQLGLPRLDRPLRLGRVRHQRGWHGQPDDPPCEVPQGSDVRAAVPGHRYLLSEVELPSGCEIRVVRHALHGFAWSRYSLARWSMSKRTVILSI